MQNGKFIIYFVHFIILFLLISDTNNIYLSVLSFPVNNPTEDETVHTECEEFAECISEAVDISPSLNKLDIFVRRSHEKGLENVIRRRLAEKQMNSNWDINYRIVIK